MKRRTLWVLVYLMVMALVCLGYSHIKDNQCCIPSNPPNENKQPEFLTQTPKDGLKAALEYYDIKHPEIVYAQAVLETGHFTSYACLKQNNLFGIYDSRKGKYFKYNHWVESVIAYRDLIQRKYKPPNDYYEFLELLPYATDSMYINKLKRIVND